MTESTQPRGKVLAIRGAVVDVAFESGDRSRLRAQGADQVGQMASRFACAAAVSVFREFDSDHPENWL
jgi:hypothetical protein